MQRALEEPLEPRPGHQLSGALLKQGSGVPEGAARKGVDQLEIHASLGDEIEGFIERDRAVLGQTDITVQRVALGGGRRGPLLQDQAACPDLQRSGHLSVADGV